MSPRIGVVLPRSSVVWRASVGRGFRAPSLAERFVQTSISGVTAVPNPDLEPETGWTAELGTGISTPSAIHVDAALFWTEASNYIEPAVDPATLLIQFRNVQRARLMGLDLSVRSAPIGSPLSLSLAYTFLSTRRLDTMPSQPLPFRPTHLLTLGADYGRGPVSVGADFRFMSRYEAPPHRPPRVSQGPRPARQPPPRDRSPHSCFSPTR